MKDMFYTLSRVDADLNYFNRIANFSNIYMNKIETLSNEKLF